VTRAQGTSKLSALPGNAPTQVLRLTLDQAVGLALKQNTTAQIAICRQRKANKTRTLREPTCCRKRRRRSRTKLRK